MNPENQLNKLHTELSNRVVLIKSAVDERRRATKALPWSEYLLSSLGSKIAQAIGVAPEDLDISFVDSAKFKADIALRVPSLLKSKPTPVYIKEDVPKFAAALEPLKAAGILEKIETKGIYLNLSLGPEVIFDAAEQVLSHGEVFGFSDVHRDKRYVVDYSSPNVAKHLHAGHVRSTIIGHVLSNLYVAAGGTSYRLNYINDWGGFGELIEGFDRWRTLAQDSLKNNDLLFFVYSIFRSAENAASSAAAFSEVASEQKSLLAQAFPGSVATFPEFKSAFDQFKAKARERFANLEAGNSSEVDLWQKMVSWSLADFKRFYDLLNIHQDFVIGESFFVAPGRAVVEQGLREGKVQKFTDSLAAEAQKLVAAQVDEGKLTVEVGKALDEEISRDVGAFVVPLSNHKRMVVQRADGATIYATRDLAGVKYRTETFGATDLVYEVGQEQGDHFSQLFESAKILGLTGDKEISCRHIYHGFYVDSTSKKKLSSRQGASNVLALFDAAVAHFYNKYNESSEFSEEERRDIAKKLAIGSVVYNDLRRDKKLPVELNPDQGKMIEEFERSGGAYVVYSACRARSILRKAQVPAPRGAEFRKVSLAPIERELLKLTMDFPRRVVNAARNDNPATLLGYVEELATLYNRYYHEYPVIKGGEQNFHRLTVTQAVAQVIENGLRICHVECPERI